MKQLLAGVKAPALQPSLPHQEIQERKMEDTATTAPPPSSALKSDIDQQLAKLTIPEVAPVESIHKRLQLMQVQSSSGSDNAPTQPSPGENRYLALVKKEIDKRWIAPPVLESNPSVIVTFHIDKSGEISRVRIEQGSGNLYYDQAILRAIHQSNPLPTFPPDLRESFLDIKFRFTKIEK
jgi:TonB family protein